MGKTQSDSRKNVTVQTLQSLYKKGEPITALTAHDYPTGHIADAAGMDVVIVGDSLGMVALGMEDTNKVTVEDMLLHCRSVSRAVKHAFTVSRTLLNPGHFYPTTKQISNASYHQTDSRPPNGLLRTIP